MLAAMLSMRSIEQMTVAKPKNDMGTSGLLTVRMSSCMQRSKHLQAVSFRCKGTAIKAPAVAAGVSKRDCQRHDCCFVIVSFSL